MLITEIANSIGIGLNTSLPGNWGGGLSVPTTLPVIVDHDPITEGGELNLQFGVYVTPSFNEFDLSKARESDSTNPTTGLRKKAGVSKTSYVAVSICRPYTQKLELKKVLPAGLLSEWFLLKNTQENLENFLIHFHIEGVKLKTIESDPPNEAALQERVYLAIITLGYTSC